MSRRSRSGLRQGPRGLVLQHRVRRGPTRRRRTPAGCSGDLAYPRASALLPEAKTHRTAFEEAVFLAAATNRRFPRNASPERGGKPLRRPRRSRPGGSRSALAPLPVVCANDPLLLYALRRAGSGGSSIPSPSDTWSASVRTFWNDSRHAQLRWEDNPVSKGGGFNAAALPSRASVDRCRDPSNGRRSS